MKKALAAEVDGRMVDLTLSARRRRVAEASSRRTAPEALPLYRHSTAHLLAAAVTQLFPGAQCGIGPATDEGFFYDFVVPRPFVPEDLEKIEARMRELAQPGSAVRTADVAARAKRSRSSRKRGEPLKVQLIEEKTAGQSDVSCYTIKDRDTFVDFCVGPHVPSTGKLKAFKLLVDVERVLEGRRAQPADAAHLRHRVLQGRRSEAAPASDRGGQEARPPPARQGPRACSRSTRGRRARRSGSARARRSTTCSPTTCARCSSPPATPR